MQYIKKGKYLLCKMRVILCYDWHISHVNDSSSKWEVFYYLNGNLPGNKFSKFHMTYFWIKTQKIKIWEAI